MTPQPGHRLPGLPLPAPYGAHVMDHGVLFTLFSRHATRVWLMLFDTPDADTPAQEYELTPERNRIGDLWHLFAPGAREHQFYLYRAEGQTPHSAVNFFNPAQWLLDPYALAVARPPGWGNTAGLAPGRPLMRGAAFPKGIIVRDRFDWSGDHRPRIPLPETVIYETHLRGFTVHPQARVRHAGTYAGFREKIPYLRDLGITAVELLPVQEFNEMEYFLEGQQRSGLCNFWGYSTLAFFAPNGRYAHAGTVGQQIHEFKELVLALHQAGIELILDVVFNHTGEGGDLAQTYSLRGLDNSIYYMMDGSGLHYTNYSGCGNTINSNHPVVRDFIMNCLRYWVLNMHVDGFRFDLASVLTRGPDGGVLPNPPLVEQIAEDPVLRDTKIIAEAWDAAGAYQVGSFPSHRWSEWNGHFRDDVRRFWRRDPGMLGRFATRLGGSSDLFGHHAQSPAKSINFITSHDGFTLRDLVQYEAKHNQDNAEDNRDGENNNFSSNYGVEGPATDPALAALRLRQQKNMLATLFIAQGVPMLLAGDEFSRTQRGNNNAYGQDNEISWVDWGLLKEHASLHRFVRDLITFRRAHPALRRAAFFRGPQGDEPWPDIRWFGPRSQAPDWDCGWAVGLVISGTRAHTGAEVDGDDLCFLVNNDLVAQPFTLPVRPGAAWRLAWTTQDETPLWTPDGATVIVEARSVTALAAPRRA